MESSLFHFVIIDVEGKILRCNGSFSKLGGPQGDTQFGDFLTPGSSAEFHYSLELLLSAPKIRRHLMLDHPEPEGGKAAKVWWEFSVVTNPEMDLSGIIGIGVGVHFLEQEMPWDNLADVLDFGKITLDAEQRILGWDGQISGWFDPEGENWRGSLLTAVPAFDGLESLAEVLEHMSPQSKPKCFPLEPQTSLEPVFAALLASTAGGYHLFLVPKEMRTNVRFQKQLIPARVLDTLPGAVFVLDRAGKLSQQNDEAKALGRVWKGRAYSEGFSLTFPNQSNRFSKLLRAIEDAKRGVSHEMEIRMLMPEQEFGFWSVAVRPISLETGLAEGIFIQVINMSDVKAELFRVNRENERLRDLALSPSHILRGPLSSMIGLLELIDAKQLDAENQKLFGFLKPLTKELDEIIRQQAKKISTFG